jgi:hypothetical protein
LPLLEVRPVSEAPVCLRCAESPATTPDGMCGHCHWAIKAEVENGIVQIAEYVSKQDEFARWLRENGRDT